MPRGKSSKRGKSTPSKAEAPQRPNAYHIIALVAICAILIIAEYHGPNYGFDDANYVHYAKQMLNGSFSPFESQYSLGYLMPATIAYSFLLFGKSNFAASLPSMVEYVMLVILVYLTITRLKPINRFAFPSALMVATSAFVAVYSSRVLSDMLIGVLVALSLYIMSRERVHPMIGGAVLGIIIFVKLGGMIAAFAVALSVLLFMRKEYSLRFIAGFAAMVLIYIFSIGWNLHALSSYSASQVDMSKVNLQINLYTMIVLMFFNYAINIPTFGQIFPLGAIAFYALFGIVMMWRKWGSGLGMFAFAFVATYLYLFFGTESISAYSLITVVNRYIIWIISPVAVVAAYFLLQVDTWFRSRIGARGAGAIIILLVLAAILSNLPMLVLFHYLVINYTYH